MNRWLQDYFEEDFETNAPLRKSFSKLASEIDPAVVVLLEMHVVKAKDQRRTSLVKQGQSMPALDRCDVFKCVMMRVRKMLF